MQILNGGRAATESNLYSSSRGSPGLGHSFGRFDYLWLPFQPANSRKYRATAAPQAPSPKPRATSVGGKDDRGRSPAVVMPVVCQLQELETSLQSRAASRERALKKMLASIPSLFWKCDSGFKFYGRIKSLDSISNKMLKNDLYFEQVFDIIGIRVITRRTRDCYRLINRIHSEYRVLPNEYDDYIASPKSNGYRSIHTTVVSPCGYPVEIQVRTHKMHEICERGSAAHSVYKGNRVAWIPFYSGSPLPLFVSNQNNTSQPGLGRPFSRPRRISAWGLKIGDTTIPSLSDSWFSTKRLPRLAGTEDEQS